MDPDPNSGLIIRPTDLACAGHQASWLALLDEYACDPMGGGQGLSAFARASLVERLRLRTDFVGFLALRGTRAVGLINCFEGFSTFAARPLLNVHDLAVSFDQRGRGIGQALLAAAEQAAIERGCCKLTLEVLANNARALACYRRFGFDAYQLDPAMGSARFLEKKLG